MRPFVDQVVTARRQAERKRLNDLSKNVLVAAIEIHKAFGPGLLESAYQRTLALELRERGLTTETEVKIDGHWRGRSIGLAFRADLIVEDCLLIELKAVSELTGLHRAQTHTYLKLLDFRLGLLINFNSLKLIDGYERIANRF